MDFQTACNLLINQGMGSDVASDTLLARLQQGKPPIPGQVTSILLALKIVFEELRDTLTLDRQLVFALHTLAMESRHQFEAGRQAGVDWPPLLDEDLTRIAVAVREIFAGG